jgi:GT2 family glycosyltransferase
MIAIVIPVHNRIHFTIKCLAALQRQTYSDHQVIVVDDGSSDGTAEILSKDFPHVTVMKGNGKLFWTASVNMGIRKAIADGASAVVTMNNDGYPAPDFLEKMQAASARKPKALLCAYEIDADTHKPYYGGELVNWTWASSTPLLPMLQDQDRVGLHRVSVAPGRGLFIPVKVFRTIGLFAERKLPHYMADYDFACLAIRHGFGVYCNYDAKLFTYSEESGDKEIIRKKSLVNYYKHLFDIKGGGNLKNFTIYTFRNSPRALIPFHLLKGISQRIFGYFLH